MNKTKKLYTIKETIGSLKSRKEYIFAAKYSTNKYVMDFGCGPGYGSAILAKSAKRVLGVDIREKALNYAKEKYKTPNLFFKKIFPSNSLPFNNNTFGIIVSSHVIEHIKNVQDHLEELKRILKKDGKLIIITPNRRLRLLPFQKPYNPDHFREYSLRSLRRELIKTFEKIEIKGIYGNSEINAIERRRMKFLKNPFKVYIYKPIMNLLSKFLPVKIFSILKKPENKFLAENKKNPILQTAQFKIMNKYSLDDLFIGNHYKKSIDFIAICQK